MGFVNEEEPSQEATRLVFSGDVLVHEAKRFLVRETRPEISPYLLAADVKATPSLREVGTDVYAFAHLTIQEYLAAAALAQRDDWGQIVCRAYFNPTLAEMEVLPMTFGLAHKPGRVYVDLERLPESLSIADLRIRVRSLSFAPKTDSMLLRTLTDDLLRVLEGRNHDEAPYEDAILRGFSAMDTASLEFTTGRVATLVISDDKVVRKHAILALGKLGGETAFAALLEALKNEDLHVRGFAQAALAQIGGDRAFCAMLETLKDEARPIRGMAAWYSGQLGGERALDALLDALGDESSNVKRSAASALGAIGGDRALAILCESLRSGNTEVRESAADGLGWYGGRRAFVALLQALKDEDGKVRSRAVLALGKFEDTRIVQLAAESLKDANRSVRWAATRTLGLVAERRQAGPCSRRCRTKLIGFVHLLLRNSAELAERKQRMRLLQP